MKPQEKAKELIDKFEKLFVDANADSWGKEAKACALICVEELISAFGQYTGMYDQEFFDAEKKYWEQVKQHLK